MTGVWVRRNTPVGAGSAIFPNAYAMLFSVLAILLSFLEYGIVTTILGSIAFILVAVPMYLLKEVVISPQYHLYFWLYVVTCLLLIYASVNDFPFSTLGIAIFALSGIILQNQQYSNYYFYEFEGKNETKDFSIKLVENGWMRIANDKHDYVLRCNDRNNYIRLSSKLTAQLVLDFDSRDLPKPEFEEE